MAKKIKVNIFDDMREVRFGSNRSYRKSASFHVL
jgi:hypothetical protein